MVIAVVRYGESSILQGNSCRSGVTSSILGRGVVWVGHEEHIACWPDVIFYFAGQRSRRMLQPCFATLPNACWLVEQSGKHQAWAWPHWGGHKSLPQSTRGEGASLGLLLEVIPLLSVFALVFSYYFGCLLSTGPGYELKIRGLDFRQLRVANGQAKD